MDKKTWIWGVVAVVIIVLLVVFAGNKNQASAGPIKIGASISQTGYAAAFGENSLKAMQMAVEEINGAGGMEGRQVELVVEDDNTEAKDAVTAFTKLVDIDNVDAVIGGLWDFTAQPIFPLAVDKEVTFVSPSNFRIAGSFEPGSHGFVLLTEFDKTIRALRSQLEESEGSNQIAIVRFSSAFGEQIATSLKAMAAEMGKSEVIDEKYANLGGNDFSTTVAKLKQAGVDTVFLDMLDSDINNFLLRSKQQGFTPKVISHTLAKDALANPNIDTSLFGGVIVLDWEVSGPEFNQRFQEKYGVLPEKSASKSYDAVYVLAEAIANSKDRASVNKYLESHTFTTINGEIKFTPEHAVENTDVEIRYIKDGQLLKVQSNG